MKRFDHNDFERLADAMGVDREFFPVAEILGVEVPGRTVLEAWEALPSDRRPLGAYVHVPFCRTKCTYCRVPSRPPAPGETGEYLERVARELKLFRDALRKFRFDTLYVGGGTPSLLSADEIHQLLDAVAWTVPLGSDAEIEFEVNPSLMGEDRARALTLRSVSHVRMDVHTFDQAVLERVNRGYQSAEDVRAAVRLLREAGIRSITMDLMVGLPGESENSLMDSVKRAVRMGPDAIRIRPLERAGHWLTSREEFEGARETFVKLHRAVGEVVGVLVDGGYTEVEGESIFARAPEKLSRHFRNRRLDGGSVACFGDHGDGHVRDHLHYRPGRTGQRREALSCNEPPRYRASRSDPETEMREFMVYNLRHGVDSRQFRRRFDRGVRETFGEELSALSDAGLVEADEEAVRPTYRSVRDAVVASMYFFPEDMVSELARRHLTEGFSSGHAAFPAGNGSGPSSKEGR